MRRRTRYSCATYQVNVTLNSVPGVFILLLRVEGHYIESNVGVGAAEQ